MGRQIYSLLLLTTQPPVRTDLQRQAGAPLHRTERGELTPRLDTGAADSRVSVIVRRLINPPPNPGRARAHPCFPAAPFLQLKLAKGFEPLTL